MPVIKDKFITIQTVAERLSCTEHHISDLIISEDLEAIKIGSRAIRVSEQSLDEFIKRRKINPEDLFDPDKEQKPKTTEHTTVARPRWMTK